VVGYAAKTSMPIKGPLESMVENDSLWRKDHRQTTEWHFADVELDHPDLDAACFGFPASATPSDAGPEKDCLVCRLDAFEKELADPKTDPAEHLLAFKCVLHLVGAPHQPLHAADKQDNGGNCVPLSLGGPRTVNLHSYWNTVIVEAIEPNPSKLAAPLTTQITPAQHKAWEKGDAKSWAMESFAVAKASVYTISSKPGCSNDAVPVLQPSREGLDPPIADH
jgi:hypothetical protein